MCQVFHHIRVCALCGAISGVSNFEYRPCRYQRLAGQCDSTAGRRSAARVEVVHTPLHPNQCYECVFHFARLVGMSPEGKLIVTVIVNDDEEPTP
ncbi:hypothetical protein NKR23_g6703 [Pleurostoma richardsiae]|uniref:Uncharacterized protein n=1 Tax=Pleurostoma richardsiae TaxID=41990 RepID=A0AA38VHQ9_9PEZI|nr:hypothetical protein NKR23_g6703 [Pleurostoma richardsiae]